MEKDNNKQKTLFIKQTVAALIIFLAGVYFGLGGRQDVFEIKNIEGGEIPENVSIDFSPFWKVWNLIDEKYVPSHPEEDNDYSSQDRVWGAIGGMVDSLGDPNTIFLPPRELELFEEEINGNFEGVGIEIGIRDEILTVIAPLRDTPAYRAGVKAGDKIFKINGQETATLNIDEAIQLIRGKRGTKVDLVLFREGKSEPIEVSLVREVIDIPVLDTEWHNDIFVIRLFNFSLTSSGAFREALRELISDNRNSNKMILDLRGNPGGFLNAAVDIASWFLPAGKVIVTEDFGGRQEDLVYRSRGYNIFDKDFKMVILIDGGSASASEILAGALNEHGVAALVGTESFGKGSVQELVKVSPETSLKVTVARWVTPNGTSLSVGGLEPDFVVEDSIEDLEQGIDRAFEKAIQILNQ